MSDFLFGLLTDYGVMIVFAVTFLSCLAIPIPSSLVMLTAGGFAAAGDLVLAAVAGAAYVGAVIGDNTGYLIARLAGDRLSGWLNAKPKRAALRKRAETYMAKWGGSSVFFSCWLVAPLGPTVNYISGLSRMTWLRFALWGALGEIVWVSLYVGLGYSFADNISALSDLLGNISGFLTAALLTIGLGIWLWKVSAKHHKHA